jgi:SAM-dependent MidA family methyltransferase
MSDALGHPEFVQILIDLMEERPSKAISFREFMELCLYHEPYGYYRNDRLKIGREGDFYTSSSIGSIMGEMLASYIQQKWKSQHPPTKGLKLVEWGGGNGRLALHILNEIEAQEPDLYKTLSYTMIESSSFHRMLQNQTLQPHQPLINHQTEQAWLSSSPSDEEIFVIANELIDAFPVHRVKWWNTSWQESYVVWDSEQQAFREIWQPLKQGALRTYIDSAELTGISGQVFEINLQARDWIRSVASCIRTGQVILIDYGDKAEELFAPHRMRGTLMCYRKHQAHDNPFVYVGEQDITAHVDFSSCMQAAFAAGFTEQKLQTQREFLIEQGIMEKLQDHIDPNPFSEASKKNRAIRQLLLSDQISELFKVLILNKKGDPLP